MAAIIIHQEDGVGVGTIVIVVPGQGWDGGRRQCAGARVVVVVAVVIPEQRWGYRVVVIIDTGGVVVGIVSVELWMT